MYTPLEEAKEEVWRRWNDAGLRRRVLEYVGELPEGFGDEPRAFLVRHLATLNLEFQAFAEKSKAAGLKPVCSQYTGDKFCSLNPDKCALGKVTFSHGHGRNNGDKIVSHTIIDFCTEDGKPFREVRTVWGENFVAFHHRMLSLTLPTLKLTESTAWVQKMGGRPELFYHRLIALFVCHGIMFENFLDEGDEGKFTRKIVRPAIRRVTEHFGLKPLIVRLRPEESEAESYWCWYPGHLEADVKSLMAGGVAAARVHAAEVSTGGLTQDCSPSLEVKETGKYGIGVFAGDNIKKGRVIKILSGEVIPPDECEKRKLNDDDPLQIGKELYIDLDYLPRAFNHSCDPNAGVRTVNELFALRDIKRGEEITYDYSAVVGPNNEWSMKCECGATNCREIIGNILTIPKQTLENYYKNGAVQNYMLLDEVLQFTVESFSDKSKKRIKARGCRL